MGKRRSLALIVVCAIVVIVAATSVGLARGGAQGVGSPGAQVTDLQASIVESTARPADEVAAYPPPSWGTAAPPSRADWAYATESDAEVANRVVAELIEHGRARPGVKILKVSSFRASDADLLGIAPEVVLAGSEVDVAVTVEGEITPLVVGYRPRPPEPYQFAVILVDRAFGTPYSTTWYDRLGQVPAPLQ